MAIKNNTREKTSSIKKVFVLVAYLSLITIFTFFSVSLGVLTSFKSIIIAFICLSVELAFLMSLIFMAFSINFTILDSILSFNKRQ